MIYDSLENLSRYRKILPGLEHVSSCLQQLTSIENSSAFAEGRYKISSSVYYNMNTYQTQAQDKRLEVHRLATDLHVVLAGKETVYFAPAVNLQNLVFEKDSDAVFLSLPHSGSLELGVGMFCIFFPSEPHRAGIAQDIPLAVQKLVFKIKL